MYFHHFGFLKHIFKIQEAAFKLVPVFWWFLHTHKRSLATYIPNSRKDEKKLWVSQMEYVAVGFATFFSFFSNRDEGKR